MPGAQLGIVEAQIEPIEAEGVVVGDGQRVGEIGLAETEAVAVGVGEAELLALQGR